MAPIKLIVLDLVHNWHVKQRQNVHGVVVGVVEPQTPAQRIAHNLRVMARLAVRGLHVMAHQAHVLHTAIKQIVKVMVVPGDRVGHVVEQQVHVVRGIAIRAHVIHRQVVHIKYLVGPVVVQLMYVAHGIAPINLPVKHKLAVAGTMDQKNVRVHIMHVLPMGTKEPVMDNQAVRGVPAAGRVLVHTAHARLMEVKARVMQK